MNNQAVDTKMLDGKRLYYSFLAGAQRIFDHQGLLNKINVFPVRDADTGTNLASTMRSIVDTFIPTDTFSNTANALADAALIGARGNSGIIFAQFLYGFSSSFKDEVTIDVAKFSAAVSNGVTQSYEAISNPVEGTMITVLREWSEDIIKLKDKVDDFSQLIIQSYQKAYESLLNTPKLLEVLAKANVVDAGAKGFVYFLEGMIDFFKHGELKRILGARNVVKAQQLDEVHEHENANFRFCTEAMIISDHIEREILRHKIEHFGDSIVIAGSPKKMRIHIHTDTPDKLFTRLSNFGSITFQKVDDMEMQMNQADNPKYKIALVTDSTCDLPQDFIEKHQINVVPLSVHFGDTYYLDRVTLQAERFYKMIGKSKVYPSTAQPTFKDFSNKYNYLSTHYESIIGVHISEALSGTFSNSKKAAKTISNFSGKPITVINSKRLSSGLGLIMMRVVEELEKGTGYEDLIKKIEEWPDKTDSFVSAKTIKYLIKSGRVSPTKGFIGKLLNIKPITTVNSEGKAELTGKPLSEKSSMKLVMKMVNKSMKGRKVWGYAISHADNESTAKWYIDQMKTLTGLDPRFVVPASPVLGVNVGPGIVALSLLYE